ncbi:MAG: HTTM domain-containing protein [Deltaproteobacteria bacterium]|nr:HTTM domain-containing protein [Deltaproteobacteria bacterium]
MAKKRDRSKKPAAAPPPVERPVKAAKPDKAIEVVPLPSEQPAFWFGYDVAWAKVWLFRVLVFGLLAIDALLQIRHAPRYGAGGFNVAQLPLLHDLGPSRVMYEVAQLVSAYLFILAAFGVATRVVVPCVTAIYAWLYFSSQLDSYQHHYLVALVLGIACFVPWQRPADATPSTPVRSWALRLILVQLAVLYLWAAISKMDPAWLDGRTLSGQITGPLRAVVDSSVGIKAAARFTIVVELALAFTVWMRPAWFIALPLGIGFHVSVLLSGLEIGLFAWLMLAMYVLVVPDRVWVRIAELRPLRGVLDRLRTDSDLVTGISVVLGSALAVALVAVACRFENALTVAVALGLVPIIIVVGRRLRGRRGGAIAGVAHLAGILVWLAVDRTTTVAVDYYRFWGGSQRRLGNAETAEVAYRKMISIAPGEGSGHYQLGRLLLKRGEEQAGLDELRKAQAIETARARAYVAEAQYLAGKGRGPEAIEKAREATYAEPDSKEANDLLTALTGQKREPGAGTPGSDDDSDQR